MAKKKECDLPLREVISNVNATLNSYECNGVSIARLPQDLTISSLRLERCVTLSQYIETRFNFECYNYIPEFRELLDYTEGHLFKCSKIDGENLLKHRYKTAYIELISAKDIENADEHKDLIEKLEAIKITLGGNCIEFNNVVKKIKFNIKNI